MGSARKIHIQRSCDECYRCSERSWHLPFSLTTALVVGCLAILSTGLAEGKAQYEFADVDNLPLQKGMPDPFLMPDGKRVQTFQDWQKQRKYIKAMLAHYLYGQMPPRPKAIDIKQVDSELLYGGKGVAEQYTLTIRRNGKSVTCRFLIARPALKKRYPSAPAICSEADAPMLTDPQANLSAPFGMAIVVAPADELIRPGSKLTLGCTEWDVLDTSGHTPGGVSFYCPGESVVLTGDALFAGGIGRTDIPGASARQLLENIRRNLLSLPGRTRVLPGHGPETTIRRELETNSFLIGG